ncbi:MAG: ATP-binding protein [Culturomica sp.]|jgi:hypothetical protein|nr:ATP-binding protein [Culturomica sp.]
MKIPDKFEKILKQDQSLHSIVLDAVNDNSFGRILKDNKLFFFEEYTEHGIQHIEMVLKAAEFLISDNSFDYIQPKEVAILILAVVLHDIGMHTEFSTFKAMIDGKYDDVRVDVLDKETWQKLWQEYLSEVKHWSSKQRKNVFCNLNEIINEPDLSDKDKLSGTDKKLIGEFIRRHHARLAHEIALKGFIGNETIQFGNSELDNRDKQLIGIIARSHGINIRQTFAYLKKIAQDAWQFPNGLNIVFLMVLLRIADYLQIEKNRTDNILLKIKTFKSPISLREHETHLSIRHIHFGQIREPELIYVECNPANAQMYVKIQDLIKDIQHEFDLSWAILGEIYGFNPNDKPKIRFRRIDSNLENSDFLETLDYVPKKIAFEVNKELSKLLVAPLYGNNPTYGVRELVQNATDACKERIRIEQDNANYEPLVIVSINKIDDENYLFRIKDNGKGMTLDEILNYFLSVGSSFRQSTEWKKNFISKEGKSLVARNGKFGIGILAAFLLGDEITVKTKSFKENSFAYTFTTGISSDFIDIKTIDNFDIGTEIDINISKTKCDLLLKQNYNGICWTDWYVGEIPSVQYLLEEEQKFAKEFFVPTKIRKIYPDKYDSVQWDYSKKDNINPKMYVACNDITITLDHNFNKFSEGKSAILYKPNLLIKDTQGNLPLKLNRNDLDCYLLPFENELLEDVAKDFIAQLLMADISSKTIKKFSITPHNTDFLYFAKGFLLLSEYFTEKIKDYSLLRVLSRRDTIQNPELIFNQADNLAIYPLFNELYYLRGQKEKIVPDIECCILLLQSRYADYFENERRIPQWLIDRHKVKWKNDDYIVYNMNNYQSNLTIFNKDTTFFMKEIDTNIQSIQEIPFCYLKNYTKKDGDILNQLFEKYFSDDVIIPYDMEERKKLYPLAFEELKDYIQDYEEK